MLQDRVAELYEREAELDAAECVLSSAKGGDGAVLVIEGPAGIGKSRLLAEISRRAKRSGFACARATGTELEREDGFGVVRQLLVPVLRDLNDVARRSAFEGGARLARRVLMPAGAARAFATPASPDRLFAALHGLYWLSVNLTGIFEALLLEIDDAHWADAPSLAFTNYLSLRLDGVPAVVCATRRPREPGARDELLSSLSGAAHRLRPQELSRAATERLITTRMGGVPAPAFVSGFYRATGGNPFMAHELCSTLLADGFRPDGRAADAIENLVPESISQSTVARVGRLGENCIALARAAAVLGKDGVLHRAAKIAGLADEEAAHAADGLLGAGVLRTVRPLEFAHPLVRNAIYVDQLPAARALTHYRIAALLVEEGADGDRVCSHLLEAEPGGQWWVFEQLRRAASAALDRGAPTTAIAYLQRALSEPPPPSERPRTLLDLGVAQIIAGDASGIARLDEATDVSSDPLLRAEAQLAVARLLTFGGRVQEGVRRLERVVTELPKGSATDLALAAQAELVNASLLDTRTARVSRKWSPRLRERVASKHGPGARLALSTLACVAAMEGRPKKSVVALAERATGGDELAAVAVQGSPVAYLAAFALMFVDEYEAASKVLQASLEYAVRHGSPIGLCGTKGVRSHLNYRRGAVPDAEADAREALGAIEQQPLAWWLTTTAYLGDALLERGELDEALALVAGVAMPPEASGATAHLLHTRGRVYLAAGRVTSAIEELRDCGRRLEAIGARNPSTIPWRAALAEALAHAGEVEKARLLAQEEVALARSLGGPRARAIALLSLSRCESGEVQIRLSREAFRELERSGAALERARVLIALGAARRSNQRSNARQPLREGLELARRCGALALAEDARSELAAAGARPRRDWLHGVEALTASELRVARMAAEGRSNAEIAQSLFVTRKTIEKHLANCYMKLDISDRRALAAALDDQRVVTKE